MHLKGGLEAGWLWPLRGLLLGLRPHVALVYLWCHQESERTCDHLVEEPRVTMRGAGLALLLPVCTTSTGGAAGPLCVLVPDWPGDFL